MLVVFVIKWHSQEDLCVFCVGDDVEQVLRQDVEGVRTVQGEHQHGRLRVLVIARGDAENST